MYIKRCELLRLQLPFRRAFKHSLAERRHSDTILVMLETDSGATGFGEILARSYVSGETNDQIFDITGPEIAGELLGLEFKEQKRLVDFLHNEYRTERWGPAVFGGFELALLNGFAQVADLDLVALLGSPRCRPVGRCITIGFECPMDQFRHRAMQVRISGATVIKMKVGLDNDAERLVQMNQCLKGNIPIRLDANGCLSYDQALNLLKSCSSVPIQSLEQPFDSSDPDQVSKLQALFAETAIPQMADESVCTVSDAQHWIDTKAFQIFNIRVGKCGGLTGARQVRDRALKADIDIVAGTMVGETGVLNQASEIFLAHSNELDYVEGLGQNKSFLQQDAVDPCGNSSAMEGFVLSEGVRERYVVDQKYIQ